MGSGKIVSFSLTRVGYQLIPEGTTMQLTGCVWVRRTGTLRVVWRTGECGAQRNRAAALLVAGLGLVTGACTRHCAWLHRILPIRAYLWLSLCLKLSEAHFLRL